ncbi:MAG: motA [Ignavibacteria bacterium]|nr:motA [Ignavibacteria bacterium]
MRAGTLIGIILGLGSIIGAFLIEGGAPGALFLFPPMLIVFGGTIAVGFAGSSAEQMKKIPSLMKKAFFPVKYNYEEIIDSIVEFAQLTKKDGILSLEPKLDKIKYPFLRKLFRVAIDVSDADTLTNIAQSEINFVSERHNSNINLFVKMGGYSPTMGIIGTVMGLISTFAAAGSEPVVLIRHIASAFIATMWGITFANLVLLPIGDKLRYLHNKEMMLMDLMHDGVRGVLLSENPTLLRSRLLGAFPVNEQEKFNNKYISKGF